MFIMFAWFAIVNRSHVNYFVFFLYFIVLSQFFFFLRMLLLLMMFLLSHNLILCVEEKFKCHRQYHSLIRCSLNIRNWMNKGNGKRKKKCLRTNQPTHTHTHTFKYQSRRKKITWRELKIKHSLSSKWLSKDYIID